MVDRKKEEEEKEQEINWLGREERKSPSQVVFGTQKPTESNIIT